MKWDTLKPSLDALLAQGAPSPTPSQLPLAFEADGLQVHTQREREGIRGHRLIWCHVSCTGAPGSQEACARCWLKEEEKAGLCALAPWRPQRHRNALSKQAGPGAHQYKFLPTPAVTGQVP